jgi:hypothetical protein
MEKRKPDPLKLTPQQEAELLSTLPLERTWLNAIVDCLLLRPDGEAEVEAIANWIARSGREMTEAPKETITRIINDYCSDAQDTVPRNTQKHDLFGRTDKNTYRLRSYPNSPDLLEIQKVHFTDHWYQVAYKELCEQMKKGKNRDSWKAFTNRQRILIFAQTMLPGTPQHKIYQLRKSANT